MGDRLKSPLKHLGIVAMYGGFWSTVASRAVGCIEFQTRSKEDRRRLRLGGKFHVAAQGVYPLKMLRERERERVEQAPMKKKGF